MNDRARTHPEDNFGRDMPRYNQYVKEVTSLPRYAGRAITYAEWEAERNADPAEAKATDAAFDSIDERDRAAAALNAFLEGGNDLFSEHGIDLQQAALRCVETTAVRALMLIGKTEFQNAIGDKDIIEDAFGQALNVLRIAHHQQAILSLMKNGEVLFKEGEATQAIQALACHNQVEIIDWETALCRLMKSLVSASGMTTMKKEHLNG